VGYVREDFDSELFISAKLITPDDAGTVLSHTSTINSCMLTLIPDKL
jgi:hypothetical protein